MFSWCRSAMVVVLLLSLLALVSLELASERPLRDVA
jgi:hypothetical protein